MILRALKGYYDHVAASEPDKLPPYGYSYEQVGYVLVLSASGEPVALEALPEGRRLVPLVERTSDIKPKFLWDNTSYVFGVSAKSKRSRREHEAFKEEHLKLLKGSDDAGLKALLEFLNSWSPSGYESLPNYKDLLDKNLVFRLDGETTYLHRRMAAHRIWMRHLEFEWGKEGQCLIKGKLAPIADFHPSIGGVRGAQTSGAYIVSFNLDAFDSYCLKNGANSPVSEVATFEYTAALNTLLATNSRNKVQVADATTVFWAEADRPEQAALAEKLVAGFFDPQEGGVEIDPQLDRAASAKLRTILEAVAKGRALEEAASGIDAERTRYFILGLSPNAARISVRFWHQGTLGKLAERFQQHWCNLLIEPLPWKTAPAIWALLYETAQQRKGENIPPNLAGELMRAILTGQPYPRSLFTSTIMRCRADRNITGLRAAIMKACLIRTEKEDVPVILDRHNSNPGYRLGRLFAVLDAAQRAGVGKVNAGVRDKFIAAASATPARVFPLLLRSAQYNLQSARKKGREGRAIRLDKESAEIIGGLDARQPFPATLSLADQGRFFVGFYHQQQELFLPREKGESVEDQDDTNEPAEE